MILFSQDKTYNPLDAWSIYTALNLHFNPERDYDAIKYKFKGPKCSREKFESNKHKFLYEKLCRRYPNKNDYIGYILANITAGKKWITDFQDGIYTQWQGKIQALEYNYSQDIRAMADAVDEDNLSFDECIKPDDCHDLPLIYKRYKTGDFSLESLVCLNFILHFTDDYIITLQDPLGLSFEISHLIDKYTPFLYSKMNIDKFTETILLSFTF